MGSRWTSTWRELLGYEMETWNDASNIAHIRPVGVDLDAEFGTGYGAEDGPETGFTVWTTERVYGSSDYDCSPTVISLPLEFKFCSDDEASEWCQ